MTDRRRHRGPHPRDEALFATDQEAVLRRATAEQSHLLGRGYAEVASLKLVGDRFELRERQRLAVRRAACTDDQRARRRAQFVAENQLAGRHLAIDGFNAIVTTEAALSGGVILIGRDGAYRDMSSVHGSYRRVEETDAAIRALAGVIDESGPAAVTWFFDRPVSNSGRLAERVRNLGTWEVRLVDSPDKELVAGSDWVAATSDSWILDRAPAWTDLPATAIASACSAPWVSDLR